MWSAKNPSLSKLKLAAIEEIICKNSVELVWHAEELNNSVTWTTVIPHGGKFAANQKVTLEMTNQFEEVLEWGIRELQIHNHLVGLPPRILKIWLQYKDSPFYLTIYAHVLKTIEFPNMRKKESLECTQGMRFYSPARQMFSRTYILSEVLLFGNYAQECFAQGKCIRKYFLRVFCHLSRYIAPELLSNIQKYSKSDLVQGSILPFLYQLTGHSD
ncbi:hypothetical protein VP01_637g10 [Puccinia sorghi]|uniref:Uncharacterized protein n=1 Tax=Puccinia sorghi TaxID=27349 RepID=A0A0L6UGT5_9BASI|nr:hypothetical protein VP01_637g10 [Puccinia sorghi]